MVSLNELILFSGLNESEWFMNDLYVQPKFRRLGIAAGLISEILKDLFNNRYQGSPFKRL